MLLKCWLITPLIKKYSHSILIESDKLETLGPIFGFELQKIANLYIFTQNTKNVILASEIV
jgi:hypothetical protein